MSDGNIKDIVKEKYGQAALRVTTGGSSLLRRVGGAGWLLRPDHLEPV